MKNAAILTKEEIVHYWGSREAYNEEQRRLGIYNLEATQQELEDTLNFGANLVSATNDNANSLNRKSNTSRSSFRLFGHRA